MWGVLKAKMQMLEEPAGFLMHFYHLSEILTPVLAWGFLGSDEALKKACSVFKVMKWSPVTAISSAILIAF